VVTGQPPRVGIPAGLGIPLSPPAGWGGVFLLTGEVGRVLPTVQNAQKSRRASGDKGDVELATITGQRVTTNG